MLNGSQSSTLGSGINQKSTFGPGNIAGDSQRNSANAGKLPSSDFNRDRRPVNGSSVKNVPFENGSRSASLYANGSGIENNRENKNFAGIKSGVSSSSSSASGKSVKPEISCLLAYAWYLSVPICGQWLTK